jgi:excisionase family DNA binding protein
MGGYAVEKLMSVEQAAQRLGGVSKWTVHAWLAQGKLRRTKVGSRTMIAESDLQAFLTACNPEPDAPKATANSSDAAPPEAQR